MQLILNGDSHPIPFFLASSTDKTTGVTGTSPTVTISKNGAAFSAPAGTISEIGHGWYELSPAGADTTTNGMLLLHAEAAGADPADTKCQVGLLNPYSANVTVGGYAAGEDPASLLLLTPAHKLATDAQGEVTANNAGGGSGLTVDDIPAIAEGVAANTTIAAIGTAASSAAENAASALTAVGSLSEAVSTADDIATAVLSKPIAEGYTAVGNAETFTVGAMLWDLRQRGYNMKTSGSFIYVLKADGTTPAHTIALNDPLSPTAGSQVS